MKTETIKMITWPLLFACLFLPVPAVLAATGTAGYPHHTIALSFDPVKAQVNGTSRITLPAGTPLVLHCGPLQITGSVLESPGSTPARVMADTDNTITLPAGKTCRTLYLSWKLDADNRPGSDNLISPGGITLAGFWHPLPDHDMIYTLEATLPEGFTAITEADQITTRNTKEGQLFTASFATPVRSIHFAAGPYQVTSRTVAGITLSTYFFREDQHLAAGYLDKAAGYIRRYRDLIGPFPYSRYAIVENRLPTGYGMPTFTLLGQAVIRLPFIKDTSLGHEILHSWFGNSIFLKARGGNWCEGLTTYLADQSYAADQGRGAGYRKEQLLRYASYVHQDNTMTLAEFNSASDSQPMARKVRTIGYDKSSMVFHMLEKKIGHSAFVQGLRRFYEQMKGKEAGWDDIEEIFSKTAKMDLSEFFKQWLMRSDIPEIDVGQVTLDQKDGRSQVSFHLSQKNRKPYQLEVPVRIRTLTGMVSKTLTLKTADQQFLIQTDSLPTELIIDPDYDLMRSLVQDEIPPTWSRFDGANDKKIILPTEEQQTTFAPLIDFLQKKGCTPVRADQVKNSELGTASFLFAGSSDVSRSLFAGPRRTERGCTVDVRKNPLNPQQTMVLVSSSSAEETMAAVHKLRHYGKYSFLHFEGGRVIKKAIRASEMGIRGDLFVAPSGIPTSRVQDFTTVIKELEQSRVVYVGETHTAYGTHLLQLQVIQALHAADPKLAIGMEMFPRSVQQALDDYISGRIKDEKAFLRASKYYDVWGYDYRMYRDIIQYARRHGLPLVALNLDKEIVSQVFRKGNTDSLSKKQLATVAADRDLDVAGYRQRLDAVHAEHASVGKGNSLNGFIQAQAMWDETMAESIVRYLRQHPDRRMVVLAGTGHVLKDSAIPPRVARRMPVRQSVVVADSDMERGLETDSRIDYLMFAPSMHLEPAGKIGIMLKVEKNQKNGNLVKIIGISPHGKAGQAGLVKDDIILAIDDMPVHSVGDLKAGLAGKKPGDHVQLKVQREQDLLPDKTMEIKVELSSARPAGMMMPPGHPKP